jgi:cytochrome c553
MKRNLRKMKNLNMKFNKTFTLLVASAVIILIGCKAGKDNPGYEYAPNMYHSVAYEPLKQITNKEAGLWVSSTAEDIGEYYSSNPNNEFEMNMLEPVANTVKRGDFLPYRIPKDSLALAATTLTNPLPDSKDVLSDGKVLYGKFCSHCHGNNGIDPGLVGERYAGVPSYTSAAVKNVSEGHIFHVITHGKGRMAAHASQLNQDERWKIVRYVQTLQKQ